MNYQREQMRVYMQERRARIRAEMVERLGSCCDWCRSTEDLQFDHKDPRTKLFDIASGLDRPRVQLLAEVDKCQLLCGPHHREKTLDDEPHPNRVRGERQGSARLTEADIRDIRASDQSLRVAALAYGVSKTQIINIRKGRQWRHVPMAEADDGPSSGL